jgi:membrane protease YdiL (CAAX protease family)
LQTEPFDRVAAYVPEPAEPEPFRKFKLEWQNDNFRRSVVTWLALSFLVIFYPLASIAYTDDPTELLRGLTEETRLILFIATIIVQWFIFIFIFGASYIENTGLAGLGFKRLRLVDFFWAAAFFAVAALALSGLAKLLEILGMPMLGEIKFLIPQETSGRFVWVILSLTAGICEETAFRGYLMTRLRLVGGFKSWLIPTLISAVVFGACHAYQGIPGFIVISVYGALFSLLFIYTKTIWPAIIAHFFQDLIALFIPQ